MMRTWWGVIASKRVYRAVEGDCGMCWVGVIVRGLTGKWAVRGEWMMSDFVICVIGDGWRDKRRLVYGTSYVGLWRARIVLLRCGRLFVRSGEGIE